MVQPLEGMRDGSDVFHVVIEDLPGVGDGTSVAVDVASPGLASPGFWRIQHSGSSTFQDEFLHSKLLR